MYLNFSISCVFIFMGVSSSTPSALSNECRSVKLRPFHRNNKTHYLGMIEGNVLKAWATGLASEGASSWVIRQVYKGSSRSRNCDFSILTAVIRKLVMSS